MRVDVDFPGPVLPMTRSQCQEIAAGGKMAQGMTANPDPCLVISITASSKEFHDV